MCEDKGDSDCLADGSYNFTQCNEHVCKCVYANGLTKASTEMRSEAPFCSTCEFVTMTVEIG